jgi:uncharacterized membrane protein
MTFPLRDIVPLLSLISAAVTGCSSVESAPTDASVSDVTIDRDAVDNSTDDDQIPCGPRQVLQTVCAQCHSRPPNNGAPFPLMTRTEILSIYHDGAIVDRMVVQLQSGRMPLPPVTMTDADRSVLLAWVQAGAPAVPPQSCVDAGAPDADAGNSDASDDADGSDSSDEATLGDADADAE